MKEFVILCGLLLIDFLLVAFGFWLVTLLLPLFGIVITFSWGKAIAVWVISKIVRVILK